MSGNYAINNRSMAEEKLEQISREMKIGRLGFAKASLNPRRKSIYAHNFN